jgi:hypothetical protein
MSGFFKMKIEILYLIHAKIFGSEKIIKIKINRKFRCLVLIRIRLRIGL